MALTDWIEEGLADSGLAIEEFREIVWRLLSYQVIYAENSDRERELYYRYTRISDLVAEYFEAIGFRLHHDNKYGYAILIAPGVRTPDLGGDDLDEIPRLRRNLSGEEIRLLLILRVLYDQAVKQGDLDGEGCARCAVASLNAAYRTPPAGGRAQRRVPAARYSAPPGTCA